METKTVSELAELFGVTRQAMNKRVKNLPEAFVEKNEKNVTVVNALGIKELENLYGKVVTAEAEVVEHGQMAQVHEVAVKADDGAVFELVSNLMKDKNVEIDRLHDQLTQKDEQLRVKDEQIAEKDRQIQKQQELMEKALVDQNSLNERQFKKQQELMEKSLMDQKSFMNGLQEDLSSQSKKGFFARLFGK